MRNGVENSMPVERAMKGGLFRKVEPTSLCTEGALTDRAE